MDFRERLEWLSEVAEQLGFAVRSEHLGGDAGGVCAVRDRRMLFLDLDADLRTRYERTLSALVTEPGFLDRHIPPIIREDVDGQSAS